MAGSRVHCMLRILAQQQLGFGSVVSSGSRSLSTEAASLHRLSGDEGRDGGSQVVGKELALMRREYEKQMSELRKKFAAEEDRKRKEKEKVEFITRERITVEKAKRSVLKKEKSQNRAIEVAEEMRTLRARLEDERKARASRRQFREKKFLRLVAKEKEGVRQQSSMWIEEKDLERRILDALVDPFYLSGSYALPERDGAMAIGDDSDDDDE